MVYNSNNSQHPWFFYANAFHFGVETPRDDVFWAALEEALYTFAVFLGFLP